MFNTVLKGVMYQSGLKPHYSTKTALVKVVNELLLDSDQDCVLLLVILDVSAVLTLLIIIVLLDCLVGFVVGVRSGFI